MNDRPRETFIRDVMNWDMARLNIFQPVNALVREVESTADMETVRRLRAALAQRQGMDR